MATNRKYQNISIQPSNLPRTSKTIYELPRNNLTEADLFKKSTSDRTKRRVAHKAWFPLPVITKPVVMEKPQRKQNKKHVLKKDGRISRVKPCKVRHFNETVALDFAKPQHNQSTSSGIEGVDDRVKADKRKSEDLDCDEVTTKKQKKSIVDKSKNKDVKPGKITRPHKGVNDEVEADKKKSENLDCDEAAKKKQKKLNLDKSKNKDVKREKKSRSLKI